jgi:FKBP-type peptidyl-prolyl cis-trans isomerase FkpA
MSVTTVPIQPIKKGSLTKYWLGIAILLLAAGGLAWLGTSDVRGKYQTNEAFLASNGKNTGVVTTPSGLQIQTIKTGEGKSPTDDDVTLIAYKGTLRDGSVFDENPQAPMPVAGVVPGFSEALKKMQKGGKYKIWIPSELGYGAEEKKNPQTGQVVMPADSVLIFDVELKDFISRAEFEKGMEQMRKQQDAAAGARPQAGRPQGGQPLPPEVQQQIQQQMQAQGQTPQ